MNKPEIIFFPKPCPCCGFPVRWYAPDKWECRILCDKPTETKAMFSKILTVREEEGRSVVS